MRLIHNTMGRTAPVAHEYDSMNIILNGEARQLSQPLSIAGLLAELDLADKRVAVEVNLEIVPRSEHATHVLREGDRIEVVRAIGGG